jgi:hypothetical protein
MARKSWLRCSAELAMIRRRKLLITPALSGRFIRHLNQLLRLQD